MKVTMLLHKDVEHDSRVLREASALAGDAHQVTVIHLPRERRPPRLAAPGVLLVPAIPGGAPRRLPLAAHRLRIATAIARRAAATGPDVVHAHDAAMLLPGAIAARLAGAALVYDTHELATGVAHTRRSWALAVRMVEGLLIGSADLVVTVSDGIAARLRSMYGLEAAPTVLRNVSDLPPPVAGAAPDLRAQLGIQDAPLVLHQGATGTGRGADVLVRALTRLPDAHLLFLGAAEAGSGAGAGIRDEAERCGIAERIHLLPAAPLDTLLSHTAQADLGVSLLQESCENHRLALPNKVFEYIAAGVPVVASDLPELRRLLDETGAGRTAEGSDPASVGDAIASALAEAPALRRRVAEAAGRLSWKHERSRLLQAYRSLGRRASGLPPRAAAPTAVVIVRNAASHDGRVLRVARSLRDQGERAAILAVTTGFERDRAGADGDIPIVRISPRSPLSRLRRLAGRRRRGAAIAGSPGSPRSVGRLVRLNRLFVTLSFYRGAISTLRRWRPRIVHCNDYNTMWVGVAAKVLWGSAVIYDSHELWPDRNGRSEPRPWLLACEALFVRVADVVVTTSPGHASAIAARHRVGAPAVVRNLPSDEAERQAQVVEPDLIAYAGAITTGRGLEQAIDALPEVPQARLLIMGPAQGGYRQELQARATRLGVGGRVEQAEPVAPDEVVAAISRAAAGLALIQPICRSYELSLPNKIFEYLAAGLPILASELPVIGPMVTGSGVGVAVPPSDPAAIANGMREVLDPACNAEMRTAVATASRELSWADERESLAGLHRSALASVGA